jgi:hypothetical protein
MSKRRRALSVAVVAAVALVTWLAPHSLAQTQIQVLDHEGAFEKTIDLGTAGLGPGDVTLGSHKLFDVDGTTVVGRDFERLQVLRVLAGGDAFNFVYDSTIRLADGDVVLYGEGRISDIFTPGGATIAIIGGTGAYDDAAGSARFTTTQNEGEFLITIDLVTN